MRTLPFKRFQRYLQCDEAESFSGVLPAANGFAVPEEHTAANMVEVASQEDKGRKPTSAEVLFTGRKLPLRRLVRQLIIKAIPYTTGVKTA
ncbi:hypothetical protein BDV30DRAFT_241528 [Aspergillus minisclerotigenes]|uniref:Uncharacterized protein n=1 Tax=Aspergillus minisclerotigenes TaxID=656917 RepID=A0A5N6IVK2_9EURO|nr:hypothetical protein BDV30DRAFT_241528 [Aspergillus minisclerotigenes]